LNSKCLTCFVCYLFLLLLRQSAVLLYLSSFSSTAQRSNVILPLLKKIDQPSGQAKQWPVEWSLHNGCAHMTRLRSNTVHAAHGASESAHSTLRCLLLHVLVAPVAQPEHASLERSAFGDAESRNAKQLRRGPSYGLQSPIEDSESRPPALVRQLLQTAHSRVLSRLMRVALAPAAAARSILLLLLQNSSRH
jgi:hypothetical protein